MEIKTEDGPETSRATIWFEAGFLVRRQIRNLLIQEAWECGLDASYEKAGARTRIIVHGRKEQIERFMRAAQRLWASIREQLNQQEA